MEERFCSKVKELGCTCITISHRPALVAFHDLVLALDGEGGWSIHEGATGSFTEETIKIKIQPATMFLFALCWRITVCSKSDFSWNAMFEGGYRNNECLSAVNWG